LLGQGRGYDFQIIVGAFCADLSNYFLTVLKKVISQGCEEILSNLDSDIDDRPSGDILGTPTGFDRQRAVGTAKYNGVWA
jgi:hypothetical protein